MTAQTCKQCQWWGPSLYVRGPERETWISGQCRRHAPERVVEHGNELCLWPTVLPEDWCGDFTSLAGAEGAS